MKILILHNILWTHYKNILFEELEEKAPADMEIMVLQIARNEISRKEMETAGLPAWKYQYHLLFDDYLENIPALSKIIAVTKYILKYKPDVINISGYGIDISITLSIIISRLLGIRIIISSESTIRDQSRNKWKERFKSFLVRMGDGFICFGSQAKDYIIQLGAKPSQIVEDAAAIVDDRRIRYEYDLALKTGFTKPQITTRKNFIFVGRLISVKNLPLLLEAYAKVKSAVPDADKWGLILVGDGEEKSRLQSVISENGISDVWFEPSMPWYEVPRMFTLSQVLILSSFSETWGLVVNEAMICGQAVIVSDQCGCATDLVEQNGNGFVFDYQNASQLAEYMSAFVQNDGLAEKMGQRSVERIRRFSVSAVAERIIKAFSKS